MTEPEAEAGHWVSPCLPQRPLLGSDVGLQVQEQLALAHPNIIKAQVTRSSYQ